MGSICVRSKRFDHVGRPFGGGQEQIGRQDHRSLPGTVVALLASGRDPKGAAILTLEVMKGRACAPLCRCAEKIKFWVGDIVGGARARRRTRGRP